MNLIYNPRALGFPIPTWEGSCEIFIDAFFCLKAETSIPRGWT